MEVRTPQLCGLPPAVHCSRREYFARHNLCWSKGVCGERQCNNRARAVPAGDSKGPHARLDAAARCMPPSLCFPRVMYGTAFSSMHCWKWRADGRTQRGQERE